MKLPLNIEMEGKRALVVGYGPVGHRRAKTLAMAGCKVTALDGEYQNDKCENNERQFGENEAGERQAGERRSSKYKTGERESCESQGNECATNECQNVTETENEDDIVIIAKDYSPEYLDGISLVVTASNDRAVNERVASDAAKRGILVNRADDAESTEVIFPASIRRGDLVLSVTTEGASPALTKKIAKELRTRYTESYASRLSDLKALRKYVIDTVDDPAERKRKLTAIAEMPDDELKNLLAKVSENSTDETK